LNSLPRLLTEIEAAEYLGITPGTLARIRRAKGIQHIVVADRRYGYTEQHLSHYIAVKTEGAVRG
jgi:hypothetical protein